MWFDEFSETLTIRFIKYINKLMTRSNYKRLKDEGGAMSSSSQSSKQVMEVIIKD